MAATRARNRPGHHRHHGVRHRRARQNSRPRLRARFASSIRVRDGSSTTPRRSTARSVDAREEGAREGARAGRMTCAAIGITNQRETFVVWERKSGTPGRIARSCGNAAAAWKSATRSRDREARSSRAPACCIDPYFSGTKLKWLLDARPELRARAARGELCFGTIDTWLIFRLSRGAAFVTDYTNASRTMLFNLERSNGTTRCSRCSTSRPRCCRRRSARAVRWRRLRRARSATRAMPIARGDRRSASGAVRPARASKPATRNRPTAPARFC